MIEDVTAPIEDVTAPSDVGSASHSAPTSIRRRGAWLAGRKPSKRPRAISAPAGAPVDDAPLTDVQIARSASRGAVASLTRNGAVLVLQAASSLVVARLIDPRSYGVFGLSLTLTSALIFLGDLGVTARLEVLRRTDLEEVRRSLAIGLAVAAIGGVVVSTIWQFLPLVETGPSGSRFVAPVLALTFLLTVPRQPATALLNRRLKFRAVANARLLVRTGALRPPDSPPVRRVGDLGDGERICGELSCQRGLPHRCCPWSSATESTSTDLPRRSACLFPTRRPSSLRRQWADRVTSGRVDTGGPGRWVFQLVHDPGHSDHHDGVHARAHHLS